MPIPFLDLQAQYRSIKPEINAAIARVLDTSTYALGPSVESFETAYAEYCGAKYCIALNSGTAAIAMTLQAWGVKPGDKVITVANSFFASAEAVSEIGATPVLVDCDIDTALIDVSKIEAAITPKTKVIIPVHLYGQTADMSAIMKLAKNYGLKVLEDACQAHGAKYDGKRTGSLADAAAFSFYPGKNLGAYGEAGAIVTNEGALNETLRMLRDHGSKKKYVHELVGWNERMDGIQGAVLGAKLPHLDAWNDARRKLAALYREHLPSSVTAIGTKAENEPVYHLFVIRSPKRDTLQKHLADKGIQTLIHYPVPIHLQPAYKDKGWKKGDYPIAEQLSDEILSLPMYPEMTEAQVKEVCEAIASFQ